MTSSIGEPFVLSTYSSSLRGKSPEKYTPGVYVSAHRRSYKSGPFVTVAAQADGIHVLDVANLHPLISHTLGPSTSFSCPPLTLPSSSKHTWTTYAAIASSPELSSSEDAGRTIWMWKTDNAPQEKPKPKHIKTMFSKEQSIHALYACQELPGRVIVLSSAGNISISEAESLENKSNHAAFAPPEATVLHSWVFPRSTMFFGDMKNGAVLVLLCGGLGTTHLRILAIDEADSISQEQELEIILTSNQIISVSCSSSGLLSILTNDGIWSSFKLPTLSSAPSSSLTSSTLEPLSNPIHLDNYPFLTASPPPSIPQATTISLSSSHVLLASANYSSNEILLHVWDVQFSVLLASHTMPIPSALSSATSLHLQLVSSSDIEPKSTLQRIVSGQIYLVASSAPAAVAASKGKKDRNTPVSTADQKITSMVVVVPYSVPKTSTIAAAMGRGIISKPWLKASFSDEDTPKMKESVEEVARKKMLSVVRAALQGGRAQAAEAAFVKWAPKVDIESPEPISTVSIFEYNSVKELLELVLVPQQQSSAAVKQAYASEIVRYLLERRVACSAMLASQGGLLNLLRARDDWKSIELAFDTVRDLTEMEIVETLRVIIAYDQHSPHPTAAGDADLADADAMQVDPAPSSQPSTTQTTLLTTYLALLVTYPTSRLPLLLSFRHYLQSASDITLILHILSTWVARRSKLESETGKKLMPTKKDLKKTEEGVWIVVAKKGEKGKQTRRSGDVPPLENITSFLQTILDSSFLLLLSYKPAHEVLRTLSAYLSPEIAFANAARNMLGALEPFSLAQEKALKESLVPKQERDKEKQRGDWRQRRKGAGAIGVGAEIGVYALEELVL